ncbi:DNA repair protein RadA [Thermovenabulum sp.]|uniref:DNA repair protein RadA n=1 Tax=Thermovenabulum sp. TaxID=3100335 RepID=UPI003C79811E
MANKKKFVCRECGFESAKWLGRCPDCGSWNTFEEVNIKKDNYPEASKKSVLSQPVLLNEIETIEKERVSSGIGELDRVLGGGIVPGSLILIGGDPGIGKSTLMLQLGGNLGENYRVLYISGEESARQIKMRADRLDIRSRNFYLVCENDMDAIENCINEINPNFVILDSVQTVYIPDLESAPGSINQVREVTLRSLRISKEKGIAVFLVGHVTKEGNLAGPKTLEHMVDTVLYFEGERYQSYRILRSVKNRFGSTNEIGIFEMREKGLVEVESPSNFLLSGRTKNSPGSVVTCTIEGTRPLLIEVQALTCSCGFNIPKRQTYGIDYNRASLLIAVLEKNMGLFLNREDVFINIAGGIKVTEPAADLAVILAVFSSFKNKPLLEGLVVMGEVGLSGEVRSVSYPEKRVYEALKLGFSKVILPRANLRDLDAKLLNKVTGVSNLIEAEQEAF